MSEKAARDLIETTISNWKTTGEIGRDLHKLIIFVTLSDVLSFF